VEDVADTVSDATGIDSDVFDNVLDAFIDKTAFFTHVCILSGVLVQTDDRGTGIFYYDPDTYHLEYNIWYLISQGNQTFTAAHIHGPAMPGEEAGILHPLPCEPVNDANPQLMHCKGVWRVEEEYRNDIELGRWYANVHTNVNPNGYIRGDAVVKSPNLWIVAGLLRYSDESKWDIDSNGDPLALGEGVIIMDHINRTTRYAILHSFMQSEVSDLYLGRSDPLDPDVVLDLKDKGQYRDFLAASESLNLTQQLQTTLNTEDSYFVIRLANQDVLTAKLNDAKEVGEEPTISFDDFISSSGTRSILFGLPLAILAALYLIVDT